jgi:hypothetical protein
MAAISRARRISLVAGAAILTAAGAFWCIIALFYWSARPGWTIPLASATTVGLLALCAARFAVPRGVVSVIDPIAAAAGRRIGMLCGIIFWIEFGLIALCATLLARHGLALWIPIAAAIIVGIHFLPMARVLAVPLYYGTGVFSILGVAGCLLIPNFGLRLLCVGLVMAAVFWTTSSILLWQTRTTA